VGLARGYLNRPELTAERFIPHPFSDDPGARLYRTGDFARFLPDGRIDFIGRRDQQVKLRGARIEFGEIETVLVNHRAVRRCVVTARAGHGLIAYVETPEVIPSLKGELRAFLKDKLPPYMVPSVFVLLDTLPLTPNGKLDRDALPDSELFGVEDESSFLAPRNETEKLLAQLWSELLGVERIGVHQDFFALGGHSLLAVEVVWKIRELLSADVSLKTLFECPTIAQLSEFIYNSQVPIAEASLLPIVPLGRDRYRTTLPHNNN
jgi:acyl carrier protein